MERSKQHFIRIALMNIESAIEAGSKERVIAAIQNYIQVRK